MTRQNSNLLNQLDAALPQGLVVDTGWLARKGIERRLRYWYVKNGWLERLANKVYQRPRVGMTDSPLNWQQIVTSLQILHGCPVHVGGKTALDLLGLTHYLMPNANEIHLYSSEKPPKWINQLGIPQKLVVHNSRKLFPPKHGSDFRDVGGDIIQTAWGQWDWPMSMSSRERAFLELLDELPGKESFHHVDMMMESASTLRPDHLSELLSRCKSVKVKRLFFFFADRHGHAWRKYLDMDNFDLGKGNRVLVKGGRLDPKYLITVPEDIDAN